VELPIHNHPMMPLRDVRIGDCCGIQFDGIRDGYYCEECDLFFHKTCSNAPKEIDHACCEYLASLVTCGYEYGGRCYFCEEDISYGIKMYECNECDFKTHMECGMYPPPNVVVVPHGHDHKLELEKAKRRFTCGICGKEGYGCPYKCHECDLSFHASCGKYEAEVNHPSHSLHPLKLFKGEPPAYTDGKCYLCGKNLDEYYYHCSTCNFTLDLHCVRFPPPLHIHDIETDIHKLTLMPKLISFTCTTCGLQGDRSPYVCLECNFIVHNDCSRFPWVININRHDHRVSRTFLLGVVNAVCGVCQKKMDWSCGGYYCKKCPEGCVYHTKCATRKDVWDRKELKDVKEEDEDTEPFKMIDEMNIIQHYSHKEHHLRLDKSGVFLEERESCDACAYPIYQDHFYGCTSCDFILHETCAKLPTQKRHVVSTSPFLLNRFQNHYTKCVACGVLFNGFVYTYRTFGLDVRCATISGSYLHQSHPHPLFYTSPRGVCSVCKKEAAHVLRCVQDDCEYVLDFKCVLLPNKVKHRVDDHFLDLCYGEKITTGSGKYWCDICEKETDPTTWFYTCKDCGVTLHTNCVLGDFRGLKIKRSFTTGIFSGTTYWTCPNNGMSRPICTICNYHCMFPIYLVSVPAGGGSLRYHCSINC
ncbi:unnamed protein product, partial [Cochlearia groenlandica]